MWGPIAGYFQKKRGARFLKLVPIDDKGDAGSRFAFDISMGVRKADKELRARLDEALVRRQDDIAKILEEYGVPTLPLAGGRRQPSRPAVPPETGGHETLLPFLRAASPCRLHVGGGGGMGKPILDDEWIFGSDDATLFKLIRGEIPKQTMPGAIGQALDDEQVRQVIVYVRFIYQPFSGAAGGAPRDPEL